MRPVVAFLIVGALVVLANAPALWEWMEVKGVVVQSDDLFNLVLYLSQSLIGFLLCAALWWYLPVRKHWHRFSRFAIGITACSFLGDAVQAFMDVPAYTAVIEVALMYGAINVSGLVEVVVWGAGEFRAVKRAHEAAQPLPAQREQGVQNMEAQDQVVSENGQEKKPGRIGFQYSNRL